MVSSVIMCIIVLIASAIFILFGITSLVRKTPMHFWAGSTVKSEDIKDIPSYNRANGIMWLVYGGLYVVLAFMSFISIGFVGVSIGVLSIGGLPVLVLIYDRIYKKYKA